MISPDAYDHIDPVYEETGERRPFDATRMTKERFFAHMHALYRAMNYADSDDPRKADWMPAEMAGKAGCRHLDNLMHDLLEGDVITSDEHQRFHDEM